MKYIFFLLELDKCHFFVGIIEIFLLFLQEFAFRRKKEHLKVFFLFCVLCLLHNNYNNLFSLHSVAKFFELFIFFNSLNVFFLWHFAIFFIIFFFLYLQIFFTLKPIDILHLFFLLFVWIMVKGRDKFNLYSFILLIQQLKT